MIKRLLLALGLLCALVAPAQAAFDTGDLICETTGTTGTGTVDLAGAATNYLGFATQIASGNTVPYHIVSGDGKRETGIGTFTDGTPDTLTRTADWSTDGSGAELTLSGTSTVCVGPISGSMVMNPVTENIDADDFTLTEVSQLVVVHDTALTTFMAETSQITPAIQTVSTAATAAWGLARFASGDTQDSVVSLVHSGGTTIGDYSAVTDNAELGTFSFAGSDGTDFATGATIKAVVDGTPGNDDMPTELVFAVSTDASATPTDRLVIKPDGGVVIGNGGTSPGAEDLSIEGGDIEFGSAGTAGTDSTLTRSAAGELTLEGDAVKHAGKQMMWIPAGAMRNNATSSASCGDTYDSGTNDLTITVCAFDAGATEERADFQVAMPKAWNESTVTFIPVSTCAGACAATETLQYELACVAISDSDSVNAAMGTAQSSSKTLQATPTNESLVGAESSAITCAGTPAENDYLAFRISRDTSVDNMAGDALLLGIKLFWTDNASTLSE